MKWYQQEWVKLVGMAVVALILAGALLAAIYVVEPPEERTVSDPPYSGALVVANHAVSSTAEALGEPIRTLGYERLVVWVQYDKGNEGSAAVYPVMLATSVVTGTGRGEFAWTSDGGIETAGSARVYSMTASGGYYIPLDVAGVPWVQLYAVSGAAPTGRITVTLSAR